MPRQPHAQSPSTPFHRPQRRPTPQVWPLAAALVLGASPLAAQDPIDYPEGYRGWAHVKTLTLHAGHVLADPFEGIHHVYANPPAVTGTQGGEFADGSVLVFDLLAAVSEGEATAEGKRKLLAVMVKHRGRYPATGGWGFEAWAGDSRSERLVTDGGASCFDCHTSQAQSDYVFSRWRD
ncbi:MAG: cytochrome P460 family protein [Chromatiaceae bacterium]|nr:cytochrome P460 family protein [Chromatiaceae bacterium]